MLTSTLSLIPLIAPILLLVYAGLLAIRSYSWVETKGMSGRLIGLAGITVALISVFLVYFNGTMESALLGYMGLGFSLRLDILSVSMLVMISILGFVILKFSENYLDGEDRKNIFFNRLAITIASVDFLVLSGNLFQIFFFWVITSMCLHSLLVFYRNRPQAVTAARKKFIVARLGDISLLLAIAFIYLSIGTGDLSTIFQTVGNSNFVLDGWLTWATGLLVITAALKSAQFPTHGWLIEVVETPTPVSALLHAGLLNAGPFLMVRMSHLMIESTSASLMLVTIGGLTALLASAIYMTQPSVKVALGYSSVAHMGFSLMLCGFGVYTAAILHVVAHSFYKAHAFLSSGSVVELVRGRKFAVPQRKGNILRVAISLFLAVGIYLVFCMLWNIHPDQNFNLMAIGLIIVMGLSQMLASTFDAGGGRKAILLSIGMAIVVSTSFFTLEHGTRVLFGSQIPLVQQPGIVMQNAIWILLISYALVIGLQLLAPRFNKTEFGYRVGVHLRNGLYANVIFDRLIGSLKNEKFKWANLSVQEDSIDADFSQNVMNRRAEVLLNN